MKVSDLLIKALEEEGVTHIFGVPGEENLDLIESIRSSTISFVTTRHEQAAGFMAATFGRLTATPGVALSTLGPGATNLMTAVAYANLGAMPALFITGQKPIKKSKQGRFQILNTVELMAPITKFSKQIINAEKVPSLVREAFRVATEERPGAVHLELPEDIAQERTEAHLFPISRPRRPIAEEKAIARAVEMIEGSKRPIILVGAGANRKLVSNMLGEFIANTKLPFFTTQMGKGVVDENLPTYIGCAALSASDYLHCAIKEADLVINVGHDVVEKPPFIMKEGGAKVIHINFYSASVDDVYFPTLEVIGDIANALWQIKERLSPQAHWDFTPFMREKDRIEKSINENALREDFPLVPQYVVKQVREAMPPDGIVALDNGMYKLWFARNYRASKPNTLLLDNALATMGAGLPSAMAAKILKPDAKVLAVCGDGGFMMNSQELETAVRLGLHLPIVIINDNAYGMIRWKQESMGMKDFALDYGNPDFVKYAESYGARGYRVERADDLPKYLNEAFEAGEGVHVIEVPIDYRENDKVFTKMLKDNDC